MTRELVEYIVEKAEGELRTAEGTDPPAAGMAGDEPPTGGPEPRTP